MRAGVAGAAVRAAVRRDLAGQAGLTGLAGLAAAEPTAIDTDSAGPAAALVLVACSGGPDSLALAAAAAFVAPRAGLRAGAVVVDHGWRPSSAAEAARAAAACAGLGLVPVRVVAVAEDQGAGEGPAAAARRARD